VTGTQNITNGNPFNIQLSDFPIGSPSSAVAGMSSSTLLSSAKGLSPSFFVLASISGVSAFFSVSAQVSGFSSFVSSTTTISFGKRKVEVEECKRDVYSNHELR
jgi:hypothetical protein